MGRCWGGWRPPRCCYVVRKDPKEKVRVSCEIFTRNQPDGGFVPWSVAGAAGGEHRSTGDGCLAAWPYAGGTAKIRKARRKHGTGRELPSAYASLLVEAHELVRGVAGHGGTLAFEEEAALLLALQRSIMEGGRGGGKIGNFMKH